MSLPSAESLRWFALPDTVRPKRQQGAYSCTATSLSYAYEILGIKERPSTLHKEMGIGDMGSCWTDLITEIMDRGLGVGLYRQKTYEDLLDVQIVTQAPILVVWNSLRDEDMPNPSGIGHHMSVVQEINEVEIVLMDPAYGDYYELSREVFLTLWDDENHERSFLVINP